MSATIKKTIRAANLSNLRDRLARLNRRATKLGVEPVVLVAGEPYAKKDDFGKVRELVDVEVSAATPKLAGWTLLAVRDFSLDEPLLNRVPGGPEVDLLAYANGPADCDHCKASRKRAETFVLQNEDGTLRQVGRTCIQDFLGGQSPESLVWLADCAMEVGAALDEFERSGHDEPLVGAVEFLEVVSAAVREKGWLSRTKARELGNAGPSTSDYAFDRFFPPQAGTEARRAWDKDAVTVLPADVERARLSLEWARAIDANDQNDYKRNLGRACRSEVVRSKHAGVVASAVAAWARENERELERRRRAEREAESVFVGTVGSRLRWKAATARKPAVAGWTLQLASSKTWESQWGVTHFYRFWDADGNVVVTFATRALGMYLDEGRRWTEVEVGGTYLADGTVKKHEERNGVKQTVLTRVEVVGTVEEEKR